jgi:ribosomal protein L12E/L44/L45/RPP1/RPP2
VFAAMERIKSAKAEEDARIAAEKQRKKEEEERRKRNEELLKALATTISTYQGKLDANASCIDPSLAEELSLVFEQASMVVEAEEVSMAADVQTLLDGYLPLIDEAVAGCAGGGAAPAPEDGGDEAPAEEGGDEAPAEEGEEAPAEEGDGGE